MVVNEQREIVVIGAGAVGVACALWLRRRGHDVLLVDRGEIGGATSFGNAATIADHACTPVAQPKIWSDMPGLLFGVDSPLSVRWSRIGQFGSWLAAFLGQCNQRAFLANTAALGRLLRDAHDGYAPLLEDNPAAATLIRRNGCLYTYKTDASFERAAADIELRRELGIRQDMLSAAEVAQLEPAMEGRAARGVLFPSATHLIDPQDFVKTLALPLLAEQRYVRMDIAKLSTDASGISLRSSNGDGLRADRVVIAGGAWSANLAAQMGDRIRLGAERGYHVEFQLEAPLFSRPTCVVESGFYMTPLRDLRLRAAGTVELSGWTTPLNGARTAFIERSLRRNIGLKAPVSSSWLGIRPTMPDYLPVIGPSSEDKRVIYAFGHQHLGMTLAGTTGELVARLVAGETPDVLRSVSVQRFK